MAIKDIKKRFVRRNEFIDLDEKKVKELFSKLNFIKGVENTSFF